MTHTEKDRVSIVYQTTYTYNQPVLNMMGEKSYCFVNDMRESYCFVNDLREFLLVLGA